ncbi:hypothetical protein BH23BAC3_BH23BAC3_31130 [soil metagenome]
MPNSSIHITLAFLLFFGCSKQEDTSWVSTYSWGNGYEGELLYFDDNGKFRFTPYSDAKISGYKSYYTGKYLETDSTLHLELIHFVEESTNEEMIGFSGIKKQEVSQPLYSFQYDSVLYKVPWDSRTYLISMSNMIDFISDVNSESEPRTGSFQRFFVNRDEQDLSLNNLPAVPNDFKDLIDTTSISGEIAKILSDSTVSIVFETRKTLQPGFVFWGGLLDFKLISIEQNQAIAKVYGPFQNYPIREPIYVEMWSEEDLKMFGFKSGTTVKNKRER